MFAAVNYRWSYLHVEAGLRQTSIERRTLKQSVAPEFNPEHR